MKVADRPELTGERTAPGIASENYWYRRHLAAYRFARKLAGQLVVDAGCGEGYGTAMLARRSKTVIGLDLDRPTLDEARRRYLEPRFVRGDLDRLPLAEGSVDTIVALQVIEHLHDPDAFLSASASALRPGGILVLSTPNRATFPAGLNPFHTHEYEAEELYSLLARHFSSVEMLGLSHRAPLRGLDLFLGEPVQHLLVSKEYRELLWLLRLVLRSVTSFDFRINRRPATSLDLIAVCRTTRSR